MLILMAFAVLANVFVGQLAWIEHRAYPGGPTEFLEDQLSYWVNVIGTTSDVLCDFLGNSLLASVTGLLILPKANYRYVQYY